MPKGRILAVDDQLYFRELLEGMLVEAGFEVQTASSGDEALRVLDHASFDILVTDLVMPGMDGNELVHRVKQRDPEQDIVVVTGVVDVKTAVDSMKFGASEYLLKPFDAETLANTLDGVLHRKRLRVEHDRLLAENIEYLGERTLIERATSLFSFLSVEPLAERIVDSLCVETGAQGGVLWIASEPGDALELASARGLVQVADEPETVAIGALPAGLSESTASSAVVPWGDDAGEQAALYLVMRAEGRVIGLARLTDKLSGEDFDPVDRSCGEKFVGFAQTALHNALRYSALERRTLADASTGAYIYEYFQDAVRNEIEKSTRHGRCFSILKVEFGSLDALRRQIGDGPLREWLAGVVEHLSRLQRSSDLLASDGEGHFLALLPEADALGAAVLKHRAAEALEHADLLSDLDPGARPRAHLAVATYPADGTQLESLIRLLDERVEEDRKSAVRVLGLDQRSFGEALEALLEQGWPERPESAARITRFVFDEPARQPLGRRLLFASPGRVLSEAVRGGLDALASIETRTEIAVLSDANRPDQADTDVSWIAPSGDRRDVPPFLIHFGDGPAYALVCDDTDGEAPTRFFHTSDRCLVEHLAFRVQHDLTSGRAQ